MRQYFFMLLLFQFMATIWCQCKFTVKEIEDETRLVATARNGQIEILNEDKVYPGDIVYFICTDSDVVQVTCGRNGKFNHNLPIQNCANPPKAVVNEILDNSCRGITYRVGYNIGSGFLEIYRSCFRKLNLAAVATTHDARPYALVTKRPEATFTTDGVMTMKDAASYQAKFIFDRFEKLLGPKQPYVRSKTDLVFDRGHLAPSADFLFPINMRATFKYINAIPQFSSINRGNWKSIEDFVRKRIDSTGPARIMTGAFDVLALPDRNGNLVQMYLADGNRNPIPKWIYKIIHFAHETFVFLTYNNIFDSNPTAPSCQIVACPVQLKNSVESGLTVCCDANDFINHILPHIK